MQDKLPEEYWGEIQAVVSFSRKVKLNYDCLRAIVFELANGLPFKEAVSDLNIVNLERDKYSIMLRYENGIVALRKECWMDMFADDEVTVWLSDKRGYDYVHVTFDPSSAQWNDKVVGNIILPDEFKLDYYNCDDDDVEEKKLVEAAQKTKPAYILIKREYGKDIHYAV